MTKIKFSLDEMKFISVVESVTGARVKDCIIDEKVLFIVYENEMGKAIGKQGANLHKVENILKRRVQFVEFSEDPATFIRNYLQPLRVDVRMEDSTAVVRGNDTKTRGLVIGRDRKNINQLKDVANRYFKISEIKVE